MSLKMYAAMPLTTLALVACNSDDDKKVASEPKNTGEVIRNIDLQSKKIDTEGFSGLWLKIDHKIEIYRGTFDNGFEYTDKARSDVRYFIRVTEDGNKITFDECYHGKEFNLVSENKYMDGITTLTIIDDNEIHGFNESKSDSQDYSNSFKMVKVSSDVNALIGTMSYKINNNEIISEGKEELTCYKETYSETDFEEEEGRIQSTLSIVSSETSTDSSVEVSDNSSLDDQFFSLDIKSLGNYNAWTEDEKGAVDFVMFESSVDGSKVDIDNSEEDHYIDISYSLDF